MESKEPVRDQLSLLELLTGFHDEFIKGVKHAARPLSLVMPHVGITDSRKVVNGYDNQQTRMARLGLSIVPIVS